LGGKNINSPRRQIAKALIFSSEKDGKLTYRGNILNNCIYKDDGPWKEKLNVKNKYEH